MNKHFYPSLTLVIMAKKLSMIIICSAEQSFQKGVIKLIV